MVSMRRLSLYDSCCCCLRILRRGVEGEDRDGEGIASEMALLR